MLKHEQNTKQHGQTVQPPSGGCVLKHIGNKAGKCAYAQPPSGGCVLKLERICDNLERVRTSRLQAAVC